MCPYELSIALQGFVAMKKREGEEYLIKYKQQENLAIYQAYLISRWVWQKKVDINKFLNNNPKKKAKTNQEIFEQLKAMTAMTGS